MMNARHWGLGFGLMALLFGGQVQAAVKVADATAEQYLTSSSEWDSVEAVPSFLQADAMVAEEGAMALLDGGLTPWAYTTGMTNSVPCWAGYDPCTTDFRLPLGVGWGGQDADGNRSMSPKATQNAAYCGSGNSVGPVVDGKNLILYWPHAFAIDMNPSSDVMVKFRITVYQNSLSGCVGSNTYLGGDTASCVPNYEGVDWMEAHGDGRGDCEGSYSDPTNCHLPDVALTHPGTAVTRHYRYYLYVDTCNADGTNCSTSSNNGCFSVDWF